MKIPLYSYRNVFNDGKEKLHPGFRIGVLLFVLSNTEPKKTPFVSLESSQIESAHFKCKGDKIYLTSAYNQSAERFNDNNGGFLSLTVENWEEMEFLFNLPTNSQDYFITQLI